MKQLSQKSQIALIFAILIFQPIADFVAFNYHQVSFSLLRCGMYFIALMALAYALLALGRKLFGRGYQLYLSLVIGLAVFSFFNHYVIESTLQNMLQEHYRFRYLLLIDAMIFLVAYVINKLSAFRYAFLATLFGFSLINLVSIEKTAQPDFFNIQEYPQIAQVSSVPSKMTPNVYFIVPDTFGGPEMHYKLSGQKLHIAEDLEKEGFKVIRDAYSNGSATTLSLSQVYAMNYLFSEEEIGGKRLEALQKLVMQENPVIREFRRRGYKFYRFADGMTGYCFGNEDKCFNKNNFFTMQDSIFADRTLFPKIIKHIFWISKNEIPGQMEMNEFIPFLPQAGEGPFFLIGHFSLPHPPYRFDKDCRHVQLDSEFHHGLGFYNATSKKERMDIHNAQTGCAQNLLLEFVKNIRKKDPHAIIIVQADHGPHNYDNPYVLATELKQENFQESFNILYAFYAPDSLKKYLYDSFSPINTFRLVFAWLDQKEPQLLEHRSYYVQLKKDEMAYITSEWKREPNVEDA